ncbi:HvB12D [Hordeum vulgare]|nr:HvB12D [Hordeum vulgare]
MDDDEKAGKRSEEAKQLGRAQIRPASFSLLRNITGNPKVRVSKMGRAAGVLENHEEGRRYAEHGLRAYVQDKTSEIMPGINKFFAMYELFAMYREWQEEMAKEISGRQWDSLLVQSQECLEKVAKTVSFLA